MIRYETKQQHRVTVDTCREKSRRAIPNRLVARHRGTGQVYRADDMKLGPRCRTFFPVTIAMTSERLQFFLNEVRLSRQITHANVCRVYDVGEADNIHFLSMEYIDGEDLSRLLKRIGRIPHAKGIDIARQLCRGLAAGPTVKACYTETSNQLTS